MDLNNKQDLISLLADSDFQGFNTKGEMAAFSMFENIEAKVAERIFITARKSLMDWLNNLPPNFEISALDMYKVALSGVELDSTEEVLHFNWIIGQLYNECRMKLEALKALELQQMSPPEPDSPLAVAIELDKQMSVVSDLVQSLPVSPLWDPIQWQANYKTALYNIRNLIKKLY